MGLFRKSDDGQEGQWRLQLQVQQLQQQDSGGDGGESSGGTGQHQPEGGSSGGDASDDPRNIGDQSEEHSAQARGAEVELSPEEREEQIKSAAPHGGEIEETPTWEQAQDSEGESESATQEQSEGQRQAGGENGRGEGEGGSRVSVVDESPPRPEPPSGTSDEEYKWHTYKVYPSGRPDAVEFIDTYKAFGRSKILQGLNMGLPEGMVSMILGPSGTGKSVCIKHMVGLLYPDEGDILVHGKSVPNMPDDELFDMRKKFGLLFQDGALFGSMNLFDNVAFPLRQHTEKGEDEITDIVMRRLNEVGLASAKGKAPNELSGGMRKRAGFARALVLEPDIVLFDEPDSGLDPVRTALLGELILEIHRDMMDEAKENQKEHLPTFCVITHDIMSARRVADYINVLWKGRIVEAGPAEDMLNSENPFIRQFLSGESQGPLAMD
ncbi:MAG TPA: ATP-binding cassette domain-containing protein [Solirubrobacteraceae bacterium]|jgi:phospholipid/cholesterol/gamma-HCH transport system ATP-binding protein